MGPESLDPAGYCLTNDLLAKAAACSEVCTLPRAPSPEGKLASPGNDSLEMNMKTLFVL